MQLEAYPPRKLGAWSVRALVIALILGSGLFTLVREEKVTNWWKRMRMV